AYFGADSGSGFVYPYLSTDLAHSANTSQERGNWGEWPPPGNVPFADHNYGYLCYVPAASGGGRKGSLVKMANIGANYGGTADRSANGTPQVQFATHIADLSQKNPVNAWARFAKTIWRSSSLPYGASCFDTRRNKAYYLGQHPWTPGGVLI